MLRFNVEKIHHIDVELVSYNLIFIDNLFKQIHTYIPKKCIMFILLLCFRPYSFVLNTSHETLIQDTLNFP